MIVVALLSYMGKAQDSLATPPHTQRHCIVHVNLLPITNDTAPHRSTVLTTATTREIMLATVTQVVIRDAQRHVKS
jgi:hypothetical protein